MKEIFTDRKLCDKRNYRTKVLILLLGLFSSAIVSCFFCLSGERCSSGTVPFFCADSLEFAEMQSAEPLAEQNILGNAPFVRDPVCKRNVSRRQFKFFSAVSAAIFHYVPAELFAVKISGSYVFLNSAYTPLQLENRLFIRDGPVTDVNFNS